MDLMAVILAVAPLPLTPSRPPHHACCLQAQREAAIAAKARAAAQEDLARIFSDLEGARGDTEVRVQSPFCLLLLSVPPSILVGHALPFLFCFLGPLFSC